MKEHECISKNQSFLRLGELVVWPMLPSHYGYLLRVSFAWFQTDNQVQFLPHLQPSNHCPQVPIWELFFKSQVQKVSHVFEDQVWIEAISQATDYAVPTWLALAVVCKAKSSISFISHELFSPQWISILSRNLAMYFLIKLSPMALLLHHTQWRNTSLKVMSLSRSMPDYLEVLVFFIL